ncbi:hypothetical protein H5410_014289 [Solanum commersonii]|uniref:Uncharacterized protein n=1 Tax=Solanum commersonii TaxID=4109 RepID=A0A9J5ZQI4_SOLCO|nr:hypothetical protein H5410_014289 [Solanum commersonii]
MFAFTSLEPMTKLLAKRYHGIYTFRKCKIRGSRIWLEHDSTGLISAAIFVIYTHNLNVSIWSKRMALWYKKIIRQNQPYCEHEELPSVNNICSIDGVLHMEAQVFNKGNQKEIWFLIAEYYQVTKFDKKMMKMELDFVSLNQDLFRVDILQGIIDFLRVGETEASKIGKRHSSLSTFIGGPRDTHGVDIWMLSLSTTLWKTDLL